MTISPVARVAALLDTIPPDRRQDATLILSHADADAFAADGLPPSNLEGVQVALGAFDETRIVYPDPRPNPEPGLTIWTNLGRQIRAIHPAIRGQAAVLITTTTARALEDLFQTPGRLLDTDGQPQPDIRIHGLPWEINDNIPDPAHVCFIPPTTTPAPTPTPAPTIHTTRARTHHLTLTCTTCGHYATTAHLDHGWWTGHCPTHPHSASTDAHAPTNPRPVR